MAAARGVDALPPPLAVHELDSQYLDDDINGLLTSEWRRLSHFLPVRCFAVRVSAAVRSARTFVPPPFVGGHARVAHSLHRPPSHQRRWLEQVEPESEALFNAVVWALSLRRWDRSPGQDLQGLRYLPPPPEHQRRLPGTPRVQVAVVTLVGGVVVPWACARIRGLLTARAHELASTGPVERRVRKLADQLDWVAPSFRLVSLWYLLAFGRPLSARVGLLGFVPVYAALLPAAGSRPGGGPGPASSWPGLVLPFAQQVLWDAVADFGSALRPLVTMVAAQVMAILRVCLRLIRRRLRRPLGGRRPDRGHEGRASGAIENLAADSDRCVVCGALPARMACVGLRRSGADHVGSQDAACDHSFCYACLAVPLAAGRFACPACDVDMYGLRRRSWVPGPRDKSSES